jgi:hypothetical protein
MERRRRLTLIGIDSDAEGTRPYPIRLVCSVDGGDKLVVWGHDQARHNVDAIRRANFPCTVLCMTTTPPQQLPHVPTAVAWVHPNDFLTIE